jgi:hypothetical protein
LADRCLCGIDSLRNFLLAGSPLSGRDWDMLVRTLGVSQDEWIKVAQAQPVDSSHAVPLAGCGAKVAPAADRQVRTVFGILDDFYEHATQQFLRTA